MSEMHETVLLQEAVDALVTTSDGIYVDGTFGRGGHSREILARLGQGARLVGVDKDPTACAEAERLALGEPRFTFYHGSFALLPHQLRCMGIGAVDGILLDLGVSSPQLDDSERGFSFQNDGPLDMRMDTSSGETAAQWVASASEAELIQVFREYGEERFAKRIAGAIVAERAQRPFETTAHLSRVVSEANPRWEKHKHPATRVFQAIRIHINRELLDLKALLEDALDMLAVGGRLVVISFHSLEDRLVKRYMRDMARGEMLPAGVPVRDEALNRKMKILAKAVRASDEEVSLNTRSRSAIMRVAEKIA